MPQGSCGFLQGAEDVPRTLDYEGFDCQRSTWKDTGFCLLHAEIDGKPTEALMDELRGESVLDGAYLVDVEFPSHLDLEGRSCVKVRFDGSTLQNGNFADADLRGATFVGADLLDASFDGAVATYVDFRRSRLSGSTLVETLLYAADLREATAGQVDLTDAILRAAELADAEIASSDFEAADLLYANLEGSDLGDSNFAEADLADANLRETNLANASLADCDATQADFDAADMARADLRGAKLFHASLREVRLDGALFTDVQLDEGTEITVPYTEEGELEKAASTYRRLERLMQANADDERRWTMFRRRHEARRRQMRASGSYARWTLQTLWKAIARHGSSHHRVAWVSIGLIAISALLYPLGGLELDGARLLDYSMASDAGSLAFLLFESLYFSAITFTTVGYGDITPATPLSQGIATVETVLGAFLMALFVFVLGRRTT